MASMVNTKADEVRVGDYVRLANAGKPRGVPWLVTEVSDRKRQHYWGFWYRELKVETASNGRKRTAPLGTWEVVIVGHVVETSDR